MSSTCIRFTREETDFMTSDSRFTRRQMLQITGGTAVIGLAGCSGAPTNDTQGGEGESSTDGGGDGHHDGGSSTDGGGDSHHNEESSTDSGGDSHHGEIGTPTDAAEVKMVTENEENHFEPHVVRVNKGGTVTWTLDSGSHSTTAYHPDNDQPQLIPDGAASWDSGILSEAGATFEQTFETEGVYHYYCTPHETQGMLGSVIVGKPDPEKQVALKEPPADKPESVRKKLSELNEMIRSALNGH